MMFRTELTPAPSEVKIELGDRMITMGSCFSEMMGNRLSDAKFDILSNPLGILFNPISLFRNLRYALGDEVIPDDFAQLNDVYYHFDAHSRIFARNPEDLKNKIKTATNELRNFLSVSKWLFLTFGTANVYTHQGRVVANCHKQPAAMFESRTLSVKEMLNDAVPVIDQLKQNFPRLKIIITVSPIRHIRDTLERNSLSKSLLRVFCHELSTQNSHIQYFPSYELMMDDLRDYRFYTRDMIHPNEIAEDYIYNKFADAYFGDETKNTLDEWRNLRQAIAHKPFHPESDAHQAFLHKTLARLKKIASKLNVSREIEQIEELLTK